MIKKSLHQALRESRTENEATARALEQCRLEKSRAVADLSQVESESRRAVFRITAQLNSVSDAADELRAENHQHEETIAMLRSEIKEQQAKASFKASNTCPQSIPAASLSPESALPSSSSSPHNIRCTVPPQRCASGRFSQCSRHLQCPAMSSPSRCAVLCSSRSLSMRDDTGFIAWKGKSV